VRKVETDFVLVRLADAGCGARAKEVLKLES